MNSVFDIWPRWIQSATIITPSPAVFSETINLSYESQHSSNVTQTIKYNMSNMSQYQTIPSMYKSIINNHFLNDPQTKAKNVYFLFISPVSFGTICHAANNKYITSTLYNNILIYPNFIPKTSNPIFLYFYLG